MGKETHTQGNVSSAHSILQKSGKDFAVQVDAQVMTRTSLLIHGSKEKISKTDF